MEEINNLCYEQLKTIKESVGNIDGDIKKIVENIKENNGILFFTGVGKNAHVASKTASTFASIGIRSMFIDPVSAVHGDMGNITDKDIIFAISNSGNTDELINFIVNIKKNNSTKIFLLTSNKNSIAHKYCDCTIVIPISKELDNFNIVPTVSISAYTIFLQSVGIHISHLNNFSLIKFKNNHPGGNIGKILENI